jgi:Fur family iron response transcriptional regulator
MEFANALELQRRLRGADILPTLQRMAVASVMLEKPVHMTAEQVLAAARARLPGLSRATVYVVLKLFVRRGLLKELPIDGAATVYDSNMLPHHHLYNVDTGEVADLPPGALRVSGLPELDAGLELREVDVIVRVRGRRDAPAADAHAAV